MAARWISALFAYNRVKMEAANITHHKNLALSKVLDDSDATTNANGQNSTESADVDPENLLNGASAWGEAGTATIAACNSPLQHAGHVPFLIMVSK